MKRNTLARLALALCAAAALMLTGCGGDNGVSQGMHDDLQMDHNELEIALKAEKAKVVALTAQIDGDGTADNPGLTAELMAATARIGSADEPTSLLGMLAAEQARATMLMQQIDGDGTADNPGLTAEFMAATARIGSADEPTSLLGMLAAEQARATMLTQQIDGDGTADNPGLTAQLMDAKARIAALEGGTAPDVLDPIKTGASGAATAAAAASTAAGMAADEAETAAMNRATIQTGDANSVADAKYARMHANTAAAEAKKASAASAMAEAAMNAAEAMPHRAAAQAARDAAMEAQTMAGAARDEAVADAALELKIVDKTKSVGDPAGDGTAITIDGQARSTTVDGKTKDTGLIKSMVVGTPGMRTVNGVPVADEEGESGDRMAADAEIGFTYDSADDDTRLTLVHSYLGTQKQTQFVRNGDDSPFDGTNETPTLEAPTGGQNLAPTTSAVATDEMPTGSVTIEANASHNTEEVVAVPEPAEGDFRAFNATKESTTLYYVDSEVKDVTTGDTDDGIDQTKIYLERDREAGVVTYNIVAVVEVTVDSPSSFKHIHYGLWNDLSGTGANKVSDLGIGFVTVLADGEGLTATGDMPNIGKSTYTGNWVANVQEADEDSDGTITRKDGEASIVASFEKNDVDVTLKDFVMLENGTLEGNTFSGTKVSLVDMDLTADGTQTDSRLGVDGKFEGTFEGAFFGPRAAEAGGVFDFDGDEDGAFRGSFGGAR